MLRNYLIAGLSILGLLALAFFAFQVFRAQVMGTARSMEATSTIQASPEATGVTPEPAVTSTERTYNIVTLLPFDAIPAIDARSSTAPRKRTPNTSLRNWSWV